MGIVGGGSNSTGFNVGGGDNYELNVGGGGGGGKLKPSSVEGGGGGGGKPPVGSDGVSIALGSSAGVVFFAKSF